MRKGFILTVLSIFWVLFVQNVFAVTPEENATTLYYHGIDIRDLKLQTKGIREILIPKLDTRVYNNTIRIRSLVSFLAPKRVILSNNGANSSHGINSSGGVVIFPNSTLRVSVIPFMKRINEPWMAGSGNGGLADNLLLKSAAWYHYFALSNYAGTFVDFGFDISLTASNLFSDPSIAARGVVRYSRLGSILTDDDANIRPFIQRDKFFQWRPAIQNYNLNFIEVPRGPTLRTLSTPPGIITKAKMILSHFNSGAGQRVGLFSSPDEASAVPYLSGHCLFNFATGTSRVASAAELMIYTNKFSQIKEEWSSDGKAGVFTIHAAGYEDFSLF